MAKFEKGFLGELSGKLGNIVLANWRGISYIRTRPAENTSNTPAQQKQRTKFTVVTSFVNGIHSVFKAGFKVNTERMTELNSAVSYLMKWAIKTVDGEPQLDFTRVMIARGMLREPLHPAAERTEEGITFTWTFDEAQPAARADDRLIALAYMPDSKQPFYEVGGAAVRGDESFTLPVSGAGEHPLECYLAFASADGEDACDSVYLGQV
jgi:hypothetical protein